MSNRTMPILVLIDAMRRGAEGYNERQNLRALVRVAVIAHGEDQQTMRQIHQGIAQFGDDMAQEMLEEFFAAAIAVRIASEQRLCALERSLN